MGRRVNWNTFNYSKMFDAVCIMRFDLKHVEKGVRKTTQPALVKGGLAHRLLEKFWVHIDPKVYQNDRVLGPAVEAYFRRMKWEDYAAEEKPEYDDARSFGEYAQRKWSQDAIFPDRTARKKGIEEDMINWLYDKQKSDIWREFKPTYEAVYPILLAEGPPLYTELNFKFTLDGLVVNGEPMGSLTFNGKIDEVREDYTDGKRIIVIRDYKTGKPWIKKSKLKHDHQLTAYNIGVCSLCYDNPEFAEVLGLEDISDSFMGHPYYIYPEFILEYFMVEAPAIHHRFNNPPKLEDYLAKVDPNYEKALGEFRTGERKRKPQREVFERAQREKHKEAMRKWKYFKKRIRSPPPTIGRTTRNEWHFASAVKTIRDTKRAVQEEIIIPQRGEQCDFCEVIQACEDEIYASTRTDDGEGNLVMDFKKKPYTGGVEPYPKRVITYVEPVARPKKTKSEKKAEKNKKKRKGGRKYVDGLGQKEFAWGRGKSTPKGRVPKENK